jgi:hypothetical protein
MPSRVGQALVGDTVRTLIEMADVLHHEVSDAS